MSINKYRISEQAIEDLNNIWIYTFHKWSKKQADRYYDLIIGEIEFIADNFTIGKSAEQTRKNYRYIKLNRISFFIEKSRMKLLKSSEFYIREWILKNVWNKKLHTTPYITKRLYIKYLFKIITDFLFGFYLQNCVLNHATNHTQTRRKQEYI